ncbi:hypothetical protein CYLTODRAFT_29240 [Cylindrobasidium torrendii FP15055 ss-10]|uniref:Protein kinase domain-containing protein n=1 Tax=Cylindrobasidium torrendii FP15055 ss-10 TaxID=1314674 RepID=A0A0D7BR36_9AGAR|nr:hypothetical protein CYLTODRAFT_29240 [Cylindrobasidium torrendii FP15055 ss-10]
MRRLCSNNLSHDGSTGLFRVAPPSYRDQIYAAKVLASSVPRSLPLATTIPQTSLHPQQAQRPSPSIAVIPGYRSNPSLKVVPSYLAPNSRPAEPTGPYSRTNFCTPQDSTSSARALVSIVLPSIPTASQPTAMTPYSAVQAAFSELQSAVTNEQDPVLRARFRIIIQGYMSTTSTQPLSEHNIRQQINFLAQTSRANVNLRTQFVQQRRNLPSVTELQSAVSADIFTTRDDPVARYEIGQQIGRGGFGSVSVGVRRLIQTGAVSGLCAIKTVVGRATSVSNTERELLVRLAVQPNFLHYFTYSMCQCRLYIQFNHS